ncbi:metallophosphoesterase family protein [Paenibacillus dakarensis]|uniref:metallophosphoesterase family protein n=1 Tax=Paenibacillus dakarensis TaxID=1527293 RepID=UPI000AB9FC70|nr:metallophosphoesterase family protein [Paenibacillus dakarensis]
MQQNERREGKKIPDIFKIGVVSDTHMPRMAKQLPAELVKGIISSDLIIHAGDWSSWGVYETLRGIAPVEGVAGNTDSKEIENRLGLSKVIVIEGFRIGIVHGHGSKGTTESRALSAFSGQKVDCIIFGHSHIPLLKQIGDVILFNPGSPTDKRRQPQYSYGIIEIENGELNIRHVYYDTKDAPEKDW